ncbi:MAG: response regulator transcription factor [Alphaproteobacteria bacterium]
MNVPIRMVIADDHALFRGGLKAIFAYERDFSVVGEAANTYETVKVVAHVHPSILLLDLNMPNGDVLDVLRQVREKSPDTKVLVLTAYLKEEMLLKLASKEVEGYLLKGIDVNSLLEAIKTVHEGGSWVDEEIGSAVARSKLQA